MSGSDLGLHTNFPGRCSHGFPQPLQKHWIKPLFRPQPSFHILSKSFQSFLQHTFKAIAQSLWQATDRMARYWFPAEERGFSLLHTVQTDCRDHQASYPVGTRDLFCRGKVARAWSIKVKNGVVPPHISMVWCLIDWTQVQLGV